MRTILLAGTFVLALAATGCGARTEGAGSAPAVEQSVFPNLFQTAYRAEANVRMGEAETMPVVMYRSGGKMRMEMNRPEGQAIMISDPEASQAFMISEMGGRRMALRIALDEAMRRDALAAWTTEGRAPTRVGSCSAAGESGVEWSLAPTETDAAVRTACVSADGVLLRATEDGATTWEATSIVRGPQDAALFAPPPDVPVTDLSAGVPAAIAAQMRARAQQN